MAEPDGTIHPFNIAIIEENAYNEAMKRAENLKERFLKIYTNIPMGLRSETICVVGEKNKPISWDVAFVEIDQDTPIGKIILEKLNKLNLI